MKMTFRKIWNWVSTVFVALFVVIAVLLAGSRIIGLRAYTVLSGSMEPTYRVGALLFVRPTDAQDVQVGDPVTFLAEEDVVVTHRVVEIIPDDEDGSILRFRTKGDANNVDDGSLVHCSNLIGRPVFSVPYLGYAANYIQHPPGTYVAVAAAVVIVLLAFLPDGEKKKRANGDVSPEGAPATKDDADQ